MSEPSLLPSGVTVLERGWLSSNNVLLTSQDQTLLIDSGYASHSEQTRALVRRALGGRRLDLLFNTHLHSDHCGGNAALQALYPELQTRVPPGMAAMVRSWDPVALGYEPIGQQCPRFAVDAVLEPGSEFTAAGHTWQVHASPGHDPHSVIFFEPHSATLISADALWESGFGVIFQELEGDRVFDEVAQTLDLIERLGPAVVVPGHGSVFTDVQRALATARRRLDGFVLSPRKHAIHAAKVLLKFKLLEVQRLDRGEVREWAGSTAYMRMVHRKWFSDAPYAEWVQQLSEDLVRSGAAHRQGEFLVNS